MDRRSVLLGAAALALPRAAAGAEEWPAARPVRLVVPFAAGTTTDSVGRLLAQHLTRTFGQSFVVDNRSGAGGNVGTAQVAKAAPDGYTLVLGTIGTHAINVSLYPDPGFDPVRDFTPVAPFGTTPAVLAVRRGLEAESLAGLIALAKRRPGTLTFASAGNGTTGHLSQVMLNQRAGIETVHVPYRSGAQAVTDLISGKVDAMFYHFLALGPHIREGSIRALAVTAPRRLDGMPEVPTMEEAGLPGFVVVAWWGLYAPAGTPAPVVARLNAAANRLLDDPAAQASLRAQGVEPVGGPAERLATLTREEVEIWRRVIATGGVRPD
ncbi:Bug family tripartite tricarboxylate transporter substrate binding protein [Caldovatus aquaticus]|uniref:Tripartite tricarboxylate transporter substrate binding protein n=1 Tax=Caldovatus aquaticus TaxID=2865671 RepID=A0ABS7EZQ8_9PROT|nr:tripartite tricarboxylate transporter substrate binding protein [Caldovatus aquaticus]